MHRETAQIDRRDNIRSALFRTVLPSARFPDFETSIPVTR